MFDLENLPILSKDNLLIQSIQPQDINKNIVITKYNQLLMDI